MKNLTTLFLILFLIVSCSKSSAKKTITLAGSTTFQPFAEKLAEEYMNENKDFHINVQGGGSAVGIQSAITGSADIGMADVVELPPDASELKSTIVARDGIAIIVNPENPTNSLTSDQVKELFTGKITDWFLVDGFSGDVRVISREDGSGTRRSFDKMVLNNEKLIRSAMFQNSNGTIREAVASDPNTISYLSIGLVDNRVKAIQFNGVAATNEMVKKGKYPLQRPVYFLTQTNLSKEAQAFIDFVLSDKAQKLLENEGLISAN